MNNIIDELKTLIVNPKKGTTGYTCLKNSERVTAHKINVIIRRFESHDMNNDFVKISNDGSMEFLADGRYEVTTEFGSNQKEKSDD